MTTFEIWEQKAILSFRILTEVMVIFGLPLNGNCYFIFLHCSGCGWKLNWTEIKKKIPSLSGLFKIVFIFK